MEMNFNSVDLGEILPIAGTDDGYILSRRGDITAGWELYLPAALSVSEKDYDTMLKSLASAIRSLPDWSIVHRQDLYFDETYKAQERPGFLNRCYERHFAGRRYHSGRHFIYLTMTSRASAMRGAGSCGLFSLKLPDRLPEPEELGEFRAMSEEFIAVVTGSGACRARRLTDADLAGCPRSPGLIEKTMMLGEDMMSDIRMEPDYIQVHDSRTVMFHISDSDVLPSEMDTVRTVNSMSTANSRVDMCMAAPVGVMMMGHPHINNLYIVKASQQSFLGDLTARARRQSQFATDGANADNASENREFVSEANRNGLCGVYAHCNVISWGHDEKELLRARSDFSAALSSMGVDAVRNIRSAPVLWYASIPGAASELSREHLLACELNTALALAQYESFDDGLPAGTFKLTDRLRHIPVTLDIQKEADRANLVSNYNIFLDGASGTGKSFTTASLLYSMYAAGEHIFIIDIGGSYEQVCAVVNEESRGADGIYNRWDKRHSFSFSPFAEYRRWIGSDGTLHREEPSLNFLISVMMTMGTDREKNIVFGEFEENIIVHLIVRFIQDWKDPHLIPIFDDFVKWANRYLLYQDDAPEELRGTMRSFYTRDGVKVDSGSFAGGRFIMSLSSYAKDGQFGFLLNTREPADLFGSRFTVFDVGELANVNNRKFFSICVLCIVNAFDLKMNSRDIEGFKVMALDEAWKAISNETMAPYLRELWKTARKFNTSAMVITQELDDILSSDIIKETILQNSDIKILMSQSGNVNAFEKISGPLGLSPMDVNLVLSMSGNGSRSKDVFIKWGNSRSGVYTVEACPEQLWAFESNHQKKRPLYDKMKETGSMLSAISALTADGILPKQE